jgi:hypothetical protein
VAEPTLPIACSHGRALNWPAEIWIGVSDIQWPIVAFTSADHAASWVDEEPVYRHAYRVDATITAEVRYVPPTPASHQVIPVGGEDRG